MCGILPSVVPVVHLNLSIEVQSEPISGSVGGEEESARAFSGWVELANAIEAARRSGADGAAAEGAWAPRNGAQRATPEGADGHISEGATGSITDGASVSTAEGAAGA